MDEDKIPVSIDLTFFGGDRLPNITLESNVEDIFNLGVCCKIICSSSRYSPLFLDEGTEIENVRVYRSRGEVMYEVLYNNGAFKEASESELLVNYVLRRFLG